MTATPPRRAIVFSDVHLSVTRDDRRRIDSFVEFLRRIDPDRTARVIILGDLFDFWFEYKHVIFSGYFDVLRAFADLGDHGVECHFICGNHDFWAGRFLRDHLGFHIHTKPVTLEFGTKRVLFVHGDGINPRDIGYRLYKRVARARPVVWLFGLLHPDWAMAIARAVSRGSRRMTQAEELSTGPEVQPLREFARRTLAQGGPDVVMCGHSHYPVREEFPTPNGTGLYLNTGDWLYHQSYVAWDGDEFRLLRFPSDSPGCEVAGREAQPPVEQRQK